MRFETDRTGSLKAFAQMLEKLDSDPGCPAIGIMACAGNEFSASDLDPLLKSTGTPLFGGLFPHILQGTECHAKGTIMIGLSRHADIHLIEGLSDPDRDYEEILDERMARSQAPGTLLILVDGVSQRISAFIEALYTLYGLDLGYIGGGAGSLEPDFGPCIMTNQGTHEDCAVVVEMDSPCGIGMAHGLSSVKGPFKVTEADRNVIRTLDWDPAFKVYSRVLKDHSGIDLTRDNFMEVSRSYPFGITRLYGERVVRDPLKVGLDGSLACVGEVPQGAFVDILTGDTRSLLDAARRAGDEGLKDLSRHTRGKDPLCLLVTCISRALFLGDDFPGELRAVSRPGIPLVGACTIGEIANSGLEYIEFQNKVVAAAFMEDV